MLCPFHTFLSALDLNCSMQMSMAEKALADFKCGICLSTSLTPVSTPCGHLFCKECLEAKFAGISDIQQSNHERTMRVRRNLKPCPSKDCKSDLCDFLSSAQVNRELATSIAKLIEEVAKAKEEMEQLAKEEGGADCGEVEVEDEGDEGDEGEEAEEEEEAGPSSKPLSAAKARGRKSSGRPGTSAAALIDQGLSPAAASAPAPSAPSAAASAPASVPASVPHAKELEILASEFPDVDRSLIQIFLEDQGGDLLDVRAIIRKTLKKETTKKPRPTSAPKSASSGKGGSGRGRKRKGDEKEEVEGKASGKKVKHEEEDDPIEDDE